MIHFVKVFEVAHDVNKLEKDINSFMRSVHDPLKILQIVPLTPLRVIVTFSCFGSDAFDLLKNMGRI